MDRHGDALSTFGLLYEYLVGKGKKKHQGINFMEKVIDYITNGHKIKFSLENKKNVPFF